MASAKKQIPRVRSEEAERSFWTEQDSTEFIDWKAEETTISSSEAVTSDDFAAHNNRLPYGRGSEAHCLAVAMIEDVLTREFYCSRYG